MIELDADKNYSEEELKILQDYSAILDMVKTEGWQLLKEEVELDISNKLNIIETESDPNVVFGIVKRMAGAKSVLQAVEDYLQEGKDILEQ